MEAEKEKYRVVLQRLPKQLTHTDIRGNATHINICAAFTSYQFLQAGLTQLSIVKKGGVRVNIRIDSLVDDVFLWVFLVAQILAPQQTSDKTPP